MIQDQINSTRKSSEQIEVEYFTDPLCCWSWGMEPQLRKIRFQLGDQLHWKNVMIGLLPDWNNFIDPYTFVSTPVQLVPVWLESSRISGMPVKTNMLYTDPPSSSFPASIAIKCAEIQSEKAGEILLRKFRESALTEGFNISKTEVIYSLAYEVSLEFEDFDFNNFRDAMSSNLGIEQLRQDIHKTKNIGLELSPSIKIIKGDKSVLLKGFKSYEKLLEGFKEVMPNLTIRNGINIDEYIDYWKDLQEKEVFEAIG